MRNARHRSRRGFSGSRLILVAVAPATGTAEAAAKPFLALNCWGRSLRGDGRDDASGMERRRSEAIWPRLMEVGFRLSRLRSRGYRSGLEGRRGTADYRRFFVYRTLDGQFAGGVR